MNRELIAKIESRPLNPPQGNFWKFPCGGFRGLVFGSIYFKGLLQLSLWI
jgi:hypothetical protein